MWLDEWLEDGWLDEWWPSLDEWVEAEWLDERLEVWWPFPVECDGELELDLLHGQPPLERLDEWPPWLDEWWPSLDEWLEDGRLDEWPLWLDECDTEPVLALLLECIVGITPDEW